MVVGATLAVAPLRLPPLRRQPSWSPEHGGNQPARINTQPCIMDQGTEIPLRTLKSMRGRKRMGGVRSLSNL